MATLWRPLLVVATLVAILVLIVLSLFSCGGDDSSKTAARPSSPASAPAGPAADTNKSDEDRLAAVDLKAGDCVTDARSTVGNVITFAPVACDEPHDGEVYTLIDLPGAEGTKYPGADLVNAKGQRGCRARLRRQATRAAFRDPQLGFKFVYPTAVSWADGDRRIRCMATFKKSRSGPLAQR